jgi:RNA polymerase sigma factor (sigma-70 family)
MAKRDEDPLRTRATLLARLKDSEEAWAEFVGIYRRLIVNGALEARVPLQDVEDVAQAVLETIWKQICKGFKYDPEKGSFRAFLRQTVRFRVGDYFRSKNRHLAAGHGREDQSSTSTGTTNRIPDPVDLGQLISDEDFKKTAMQAALERARRKVSPKQFQIYDAHVVKGWPVEKVMENLGVSRSQVFLAKCRVGKIVESELRNLERDGF